MAWTESATNKLVEMYQDGVTADELTTEFGRNKTSIINKLVKEGVYCKPVKPPILTKKMMVRAVKAKTGLDLPSLEKVDKKELISLVDWINKALYPIVRVTPSSETLK